MIECTGKRPTDVDLIDLWSNLGNASPIVMAQHLLRVALPSMDENERSNLTIGERDALLMEFRRLLFGDVVEGYSYCNSCNEKVELSVLLSRLLQSQSATTNAFALKFCDISFEFKPPSTADLVATLGENNPQTQLLERCLLSGNAEFCRQFAINDAVFVDLVESGLEQIDPLANVELVGICPQCGNSNSTQFDIVTHLMNDLDHYVRTLYSTIHELALAYGWTEETILKLPENRRHIYQQMIRA